MPSNEVLHEMLRSIKEDILPRMEKKIDHTNGSVGELNDRATVLEQKVGTLEQSRSDNKKNYLMPVAVGSSIVLVSIAANYAIRP